MGENGLFSCLLLWNVFSFCSWGSVERTCDLWQGCLKHSGKNSHDLSSGVCSGCQQLKSCSHVQPWFLWNLWALLVTLSSKSSHQRPVFFFFHSDLKSRSQSPFLHSQGRLAGLGLRAGWACLRTEEICLAGLVPSSLVSFGRYLWSPMAGAPLSPQGAVITVPILGLRLIQGDSKNLSPFLSAGVHVQLSKCRLSSHFFLSPSGLFCKLLSTSARWWEAKPHSVNLNSVSESLYISYSTSCCLKYCID